MIPPSWYIIGALLLALLGGGYALKSSYERNGKLEAANAAQSATVAALRQAADTYAEEIKRQHDRALANRREANKRIRELEISVRSLENVPAQKCFDDPVPDAAADILRRLSEGGDSRMPASGSSRPGAD